MRDFIGLEKYIDDDYARRIDHRFHSKGCPVSPKLQGAEKESRELSGKLNTRQPWMSQTDLCWVVLLCKCGSITKEDAGRLIRGIRATWESNKGVSGEERILEELDGNMDIASMVNYGRTLQEPMWRLQLRDGMLNIFDDILELLEKVHELACGPKTHGRASGYGRSGRAYL